MDELQDALKDLRDIHEPIPVSFWPPALGWWLLLFVFILSFFLLRWWLKKRKRPNYKKLAHEELKNIVANYEVQHDSHKTATEIATLIRKLFLATGNAQQIAGLIDQEWLMFLDEKSKSHLFTKGGGQILTTAIYQKKADVDVDSLFVATRVLLKNV